MPLQTQYFTDQIALTSANIIEVGEVEKLVSLFRNQTLDLPKLTIFHKTLKAARYIMADRVLLNYINTELLVANIQKKQWTQHIGLQYNSQVTRVLSLDDIEKRKQLVEEKNRDKEAKIEKKWQKQRYQNFLVMTKSLIRLGPNLLYGSISSLSTILSSKNTTDRIPLTRQKNHNNPIVMSAFWDLLPISPDIYYEFDLDNLVLEKLILAKDKGVLKKKKISRLIQSELQVVGKKKRKF